MRIRTLIGAAGCILASAGMASAQPPPGGGGPGGAGGDLIVRMMAFDKNGDGSLSRTEITDDRLVRLFDRADADKDGVVTKSELNALQARERGNARGGGGPGGFGGGPGGGPGMMGGPPPPRPGEILSPGLMDRLKLTSDQKSQIDALQKDVNAQLAKILNDDQKAQLREIRQRGPGRPGGPSGGGPGGFGGPGGPGGPPPPRENDR